MEKDAIASKGPNEVSVRAVILPYSLRKRAEVAKLSLPRIDFSPSQKAALSGS